MKTNFRFLLLFILLIFLNGCSLNKIAIRSTSNILHHSFEALMAEDDLELARSAIESNLKMLEGLIRADPKNSQLLLLAAEGFTSYALAFVEDENPERATKLYLRGRDYASRWLGDRFDIDFIKLNNLDKFNAAINDLPSKALPGIFWLGNSWASSLMLNLDDISAVADLPKTEMLMRFVLETDETFYYGGAHLFFCGYYGGRPRMLGGDPKKARNHIAKQKEISGGKFLLGNFFEVKYVYLAALDEEPARAGLQHILDFDIDSAPELRLVNSVAKEKAKRLLENLEDYL